MITSENNKIKRRGDDEPVDLTTVLIKKRHETLNSSGWGFKDSGFAIQKGHLYFTGNRYLTLINNTISS